jgi:pyroglutamyl-peptidase
LAKNSGQIKEPAGPQALITGFGPFPGVPDNPSGVLAARIAASPRWRRLGWRLDGLVFPTGYAAVTKRIGEIADHPPPRFVLMLGVAARAKWLRVELRSMNKVSMIYRDVGGNRPHGLQLERSGGTTRFGRHPGQPLVAILRAAGAPARLSRDTGRYVCNAAYWRMLGATARGTQVVFVHIPMPQRPGTRKRDPRPDMAGMEYALTALMLTLIKRARIPR